MITDFVETYTVFTYDDNKLNWFSTGPRKNAIHSIIGYNFDQRMADSLTFPSFQNHRLSGSQSINAITQVNKEFNVPLSNVIYLIGRDISTGQQSRAECIVKKNQDISLFSNRGIRLEQGLACPCSVNQAFRDRRYVHASGISCLYY